eukprot:168410_1
MGNTTSAETKLTTLPSVTDTLFRYNDIQRLTSLKKQQRIVEHWFHQSLKAYIIPETLVELIISYSDIIYSNIFGIGKSDYNELSDTYKKDNKLTKINITNIKQIFKTKWSFYFINSDRKMIFLGNNHYGQSGMQSPGYNIAKPTQHPKDNFALIGSGLYSRTGYFVFNSSEETGEHCADEITICGGYGEMGKLGSVLKPMSTVHIKNNIQDIKCGFGHALFLCNEGKMYGYGDNDQFQLTNTFDKRRQKKVVLIHRSHVIKRIECAWKSSFYVDITGNLYSFGSNHGGILGIGEKNISFRQVCPKHVQFGSVKIVDIKCGEYHICALGHNGNVYSWGQNHQGALGTGDTQKRFKPFQMINDGMVNEIECGGYHTIMLLKNGNLYVCGGNRGNACFVDNKIYGNSILKPLLVKCEDIVPKGYSRIVRCVGNCESSLLIVD